MLALPMLRHGQPRQILTGSKVGISGAALRMQPHGACYATPLPLDFRIHRQADGLESGRTTCLPHYSSSGRSTNGNSSLAVAASESKKEPKSCFLQQRLQTNSACANLPAKRISSGRRKCFSIRTAAFSAVVSPAPDGGSDPKTLNPGPNDQADQAHILLALKPFLKPYWPKILQAWVCTLIAVSSMLLFVSKIGQLSKSLSDGNLPQFLPQSALVLALVAAKSVSQYLQDTWLWQVALGVTLDLRKSAFQRLLEQDIAFFEGRQSAAAGDVAFRLVVETEDAGDLVFAVLRAAVPSVVQLLAMLIRMMLLSPLLTSATLLVIPLMSAVIAVMGERVRIASKRSQETVAALSAYVNEVLPAQLTLRVHASLPFAAAHFSTLSSSDSASRSRKKRLKALFPEAITAAYAAAVVTLFSVATLAVRAGTFSGASMVSFLTSLVLLVEPVQAVGTAVNELKQREPSVRRVLALLQLKPKIIDSPSATPLTEITGEITFDNVTFEYPAEGYPSFPTAEPSTAGTSPLRQVAGERTPPPASGSFASESDESTLLQEPDWKHLAHDGNHLLPPPHTTPAAALPPLPAPAAPPPPPPPAPSPALKSVSLRISPGQRVALVGSSGSGKSSLLKLLLRLYDPSRGRILVDGVDIREVTRESLLGCMGVVPQDAVLMSGTVAENIAFGRAPRTAKKTRSFCLHDNESKGPVGARGGRSGRAGPQNKEGEGFGRGMDMDGEAMEAVVRAAKMANAHEFVLQLPGGYSARVGERGTALSGGQKQRICIARAIYHEPSILVLDEATSALDSESEAIVQQALQRLMIGRTVVMVTHRLQALQDVDKIFVFEQGSLVESGSLEELSSFRSKFATLFKNDLRRKQVAL